jgi:hypothetical protein
MLSEQVTPHTRSSHIATAVPFLSIVNSKTPGRADVTVTYVVTFSEFDRNTNQPFHAHATVIGDDTNTGDPSSAGADDRLWEWGLGDFQASMAIFPGGPYSRAVTFSMPLTALNEDQIPSSNTSDEIRALLTIKPLVGDLIGPIESNVVKLTL